jgi:hypothetical protein
MALGSFFMVFTLRLAFSVGLLALTSQLHAATYDINLNGVLGNAVVQSGTNPGIFGSPPSLYTSWTLGLSGLGDSNAVNVAVGDVFNVNVTLNQAFTFPSAPISFQTFSLALSGPSSTPPNSSITSSIALFNAGVAGPFTSPTAGTVVGSAGSPLSVFGNATFTNAPAITFDSIRATLRVDSLSGAAMLNRSELFWNIQTPVPEPTSYLMMLAGLGLVGCMVRAKNR